MKIKANNLGFTIIESIIYVAIISAVLTVSIYFAWEIIGSQTKSFVVEEVNQNGRYIMQRIGMDIRQASTIDSLTESQLDMTLENGDNISYQFDVQSHELTRQLNTQTADRIHSQDVLVSGSWQDLSTPQTNTLYVSLHISYNSQSGATDWQSEINLYNSWELMRKP